MADLHLLHFKMSHYNEKVRWALDLKGVPFTHEVLAPGFHIPKVRRLTGQNLTPVLIIDGKPMNGSSRILAWMEERYPEPALYPKDAKERERALRIAKFFDDVVAPDIRRIFWSTYFDRLDDCSRMATDGMSSRARLVWKMAFPIMRPFFRRKMGVDKENVRAAIARMDGYWDRLEADIGPSGFLVGDSFSVADLTACSIMAGIVRPPEFGYPLPEPWPPGLTALHASMAKHPAFQWVERIYKAERGRRRSHHGAESPAS